MDKSEVINIIESTYGSFINGALVIDNMNEMDVRSNLKRILPNINIDVYVTITQFDKMTIIKM